MESISRCAEPIRFFPLQLFSPPAMSPAIGQVMLMTDLTAAAGMHVNKCCHAGCHGQNRSPGNIPRCLRQGLTSA